jgi:primary-amine oxidase
MVTAKVLVRGILALAALSLPVLAQTKTVYHPLDGLTTNEYWTIHDALVESGHFTDKTRVASLLLHEPAKDTVLTWKQGDAIPREADLILLDGDGKTVEARVDIAGKKLESWKVVPGRQAPVMVSELDTMSDLAKQDPRVIAALKNHGVTDLSNVRCEPIPITFVVFPDQLNRRIGYGDCVDSHGAYHAWGRAISGLYIVADMTSQKILDVIDRGPTALPKGDIDYEEADAKPIEGTKPLLVSQPDGPSYTIDKGEVSWQNWRFRFRVDPRVGPVLNLVRYKDGDMLRSVMYEGSLSEMYVPYMDPDEWWNSRAFIDAGEFLLGGLFKPLGADDCPEHAQFFSGLVPSEQGTPVLTPQLACMFEHATDSPAWRHFENGILTGRPSRELVLRTAAVAGNYDYLIDWVFQQDGTIRVAVGATGIVETKAVKDTMVAMSDDPSKLSHGTLVDPNLVAVNHDHYFSFRIDLDVDGPNNSLMIDRMVPEHITGQVRNSIWGVQSSIAKTEKDGILDIDMRKPGMWNFINPSKHGAVGYSPGYMIMPGPTGVSFVSPDDPAQKVGAFSEHQLWVTPYKPDEIYAAGTYVTSSKGLEGLPEWTKANRSIENTDIVAWYTLGFHHSVRLEDWPIMPTLWHDFLIRPENFFDKNPVLTLPHQQ